MDFKFDASHRKISMRFLRTTYLKIDPLKFDWTDFGPQSRERIKRLREILPADFPHISSWLE
jgi:hypothetical protein